ncbi:MAG TPA: glycoside hydrolase family 38 C-terminal domain-containing protein, partial [Pyrinomonadaceae bacterium]|nr:glycoside hydrolase family 38 C-terminal domain-containing protein [Pyrinomonadaceae bacterium]
MTQPTLYVVGYAHLDTEWRWEYPQTIGEYLPKTMRNNFAFFEKYPNYIFNFTGANRYRLIKEYYPSDFERLKQYVAAGRWFPAGSSMEEGDVNSPNAESIIRQILYGNNWFRKEFGMASEEYMLPDCFGFPASLPSILSHAGIKGFSTQKLSSAWQPAPHVGGPDSPQKTPVGIPFNVGLWEGPDGQTVIAALNPLSYGSQVTYDISKPPPVPVASPQPNPSRSRPLEDWVKRIQINGDLTGLFTDYHYVGTGDVGGSPNENSVRLMEAITTRSKAWLPQIGSGQSVQSASAPIADAMIQVGDGPINVVWSKADQMFLDLLRCCKTDKLPRYKGDLELINHSAGSLTSQAYQKRWNRKNELLADAAEKASVAAEWLGVRSYPRERLNNAWTLVMGGQFHDLLPGTSTPKAFQFAWNDQVLAMNQFAGVLTSATQGVVSGLDTQVKGTAIAVFNPLNVAREDVVEANVSLLSGAPQGVRVVGPDGQEVPAQLSNGKVLFVAKAPSVGYAIYDVQTSDRQLSSTELKVTESSLENARYRVLIDQNGDVSSIFDKKLNRELLAAPHRLALSTDNPRQWPAWNMDFEDVQRAPRTFVSGPAKIRIVENGPVRISLEVARETEESRFAQTISLAAGDAGNRVEFGNVIDWKIKETNLKATFPLTAVNKLATYNWDIGTIQRP